MSLQGGTTKIVRFHKNGMLSIEYFYFLIFVKSDAYRRRHRFYLFRVEQSIESLFGVANLPLFLTEIEWK